MTWSPLGTTKFSAVLHAVALAGAAGATARPTPLTNPALPAIKPATAKTCRVVFTGLLPWVAPELTAWTTEHSAV
jgi:hypothetical protein